jgi:hypothetical protein
MVFVFWKLILYKLPIENSLYNILIIVISGELQNVLFCGNVLKETLPLKLPIKNLKAR